MLKLKYKYNRDPGKWQVMSLETKGFIRPEELYLFNRGEFFHSYLKLGAHQVKMNHEEGVHFAVWAPYAKKVRVVGSFNHWQGKAHEMVRQGETGIWTLLIPRLTPGVLYKYEIETQTGEKLLKADPYAFYGEKRPHTASIVYSLAGYDWQDQDWQQRKKQKSWRESPMLIYEVHAGSWKRKEDGEFYSYRELAQELIPYVKNMGFTHIQFLPLMEHPHDGSWGYQVTGYYGATSRYGTPHDLMYLIDCCHQAGLAVILDWVPGHFCKDVHGLGRFDGTSLFEEEEHVQWGTYRFNFKKKEVISFLISNALFWLDKFHADGLRVDGVTSMLLLNYGKEEGQWQPNIYGGKENLEAVDFLRRLNKTVFAYYPDALMIAEESTDWPMVTKPPYDGGLGFNFKWNMGWMNDTLKYMEKDFAFRFAHHRLLNFSLVYAFAEDFILPLSHDEVVHGKRSLIGKMPGDYGQKFAGLRALYLFHICHPGKVLLFMGGEFAQFIEWRYDSPLEWFLLHYGQHEKYRAYVRALNLLYLEQRSLWQRDQDWQGFAWVDADNAQQSIFIFIRKGGDEKDFLVVLINFLPVLYENFRVGVPRRGNYKELLNSDDLRFGGSGRVNGKRLSGEKIPWQGQDYSLCLTVPPLGGVILQPVYE